MALTTAKISELPLRRNPFPLTSNSQSHSHSLNFLFSSAPNLSFHILKPFSSLRTTTQHSGNSHSHSNSRSNTTPKPRPKPNPNPKASSKPKSTSAPWLNKWPSHTPPTRNDAVAGVDVEDRVETRYFDNKVKGHSAIERIVLRLRNLGLVSDEELEETDDGVDALPPPATGEEKLGDLLRREWIRPDFIFEESENGLDESVLPWERDGEEDKVVEDEERAWTPKRRAKAPSLAELTMEDEELRRLRGVGMYIRERISIPKAGITKEVLEKIHAKWRKEEVVRLKFHEVLAHDMKTAHEIVEVYCFSLSKLFLTIQICSIHVM